MHVSPGLGTAIVRLRLFSRPEATVIEIRRGG
jgi:predicted MPP superfamily phosphohydrolase